MLIEVENLYPWQLSFYGRQDRIRLKFFTNFDKYCKLISNWSWTSVIIFRIIPLFFTLVGYLRIWIWCVVDQGRNFTGRHSHLIIWPTKTNGMRHPHSRPWKCHHHTRRHFASTLRQPRGAVKSAPHVSLIHYSILTNFDKFV